MKFLFSASSTSHQITGNGNIKNRKFIYLEGGDTDIKVEVETDPKVEVETDPKQEDNNNKLAWWQSKIAARIGAVLFIVSGVANYYQYDENDKLNTENNELTEEVQTAESAAQEAIESYKITADDLTKKVESLKGNISDLEGDIENFEPVEVIPASAFTNKGELLEIIKNSESGNSYFAISDSEGNLYFVDNNGNKIDNPNLIIKEQ